MEPKKQTPTPAVNENLAADHMKMIVEEYALPERYESLVNGPWRLVGQTIIQQFGEDSDAWNRMNWFTRILCTGIETSLKRNTPENVNDALNGFSTWLNSLRDESESYSMCVSAANYAQRRISTQITEDTREELAVSDDEFVLPGADAMEIPDILDEAVVPEAEDLHEPEEATMENSGELSHAEDANPAKESVAEPLESLSLSLAYSASSALQDQTITPEQPPLPEQTERDTDMEIQPQVAAKENQTSHFETRAPAAAPSMGSRLTDAASVAPVPMGTWLAFHDQDMPTLARLAMYDTTEDVFMLGNKSGILVRKISRGELTGLIDSGMAQMVEFRSITQ